MLYLFKRKKYQHQNENDCIIIEDQNIITNTKIVRRLKFAKVLFKIHMQTLVNTCLKVNPVHPFSHHMSLLALIGNGAYGANLAKLM